MFGRYFDWTPNVAICVLLCGCFALMVVGGLGGDRSKVGDLLEPYPRDAVGWQKATAGLVHIGEGTLALEAARMARQEGAPEDWVQQAEVRARALER